MTGSVRTFSRPSFLIVWAAHAMARVRFSDPLRRLPWVSVSSASRCQAKSSAVAVMISREAVSRYGSSQWVAAGCCAAAAATSTPAPIMGNKRRKSVRLCDNMPVTLA